MIDQKQTPVSYVGKHVFTDNEKDAKLKQMLAAMQKKQELEDEFKTTKSTYKAKIDAREAEIKLMSNLLGAGQEDRTYQAILTLNFEDGKKYYNEVGTGRLVGTEDLTAADYQTQMDLDERAIKANNESADLKADVTELLTGAGITVVSETMSIVPNDEPELLGEAIVEPEEEPDPFEEDTNGVPVEDDEQNPFGLDDDQGDDEFDFGNI